MSKRFQAVLFIATALISIALCWQAGLRLPRLLPVRTAPEQVNNALIMRINAAAHGEDCTAALAEIKRITDKALTGQLGAH